MNYSLKWQKFYQEINQNDKKIDLAKASLYLAQTQYSDLDINKYLNLLDTMAEEIRERLPKSLYPLKIIKAINIYLFDDLGFKGNSNNYYDPSNSFLNKVIDWRTGIPITLSVIYLEIAKRIEFPMQGIGMPGHFLIRPDFENAGIFVDAFNQGEVLFEQDCEARLGQIYQQPVKLESHFLAPVNNKQILARILTNLKFIYLNSQQLSQAIEIIEGILMLFPNNPQERRDSGLIYCQLGELAKAIQNLEFYLAMLPKAEDAHMIRQLLEKIK